MENISFEKEKKKVTSKKLEKYLNEKVSVSLTKDSYKYTDDLVITHNGKNYVIQRGKTVMVPRFIKFVLEDSFRQQLKAVEYTNELEQAYSEKMHSAFSATTTGFSRK